MFHSLSLLWWQAWNRSPLLYIFPLFFCLVMVELLLFLFFFCPARATMFSGPHIFSSSDFWRSAQSYCLDHCWEKLVAGGGGLWYLLVSIWFVLFPGAGSIRPGGFQQHQMMAGQHQPMIGGAGGSSIQQQQQHQQSSSGVNSGSSSSGGGVPGVFPDVDMSHLSEEERMLIESVMAKAQMEELELEQSVAITKPQINSR